MPDDNNHNWSNEPDRNEPDRAAEPPRSRSGMPPVTGNTVQRGNDLEARRLAASQPKGRNAQPDGIPSRVWQGIGVAGLILLIFVVPFLTRGNNTPRSDGGDANREAFVDSLTSGDFCEGLPAESATDALSRLCDNIGEINALSDSLDQDDE